MKANGIFKTVLPGGGGGVSLPRSRCLVTQRALREETQNACEGEQGGVRGGGVFKKNLYILQIIIWCFFRSLKDVKKSSQSSNFVPNVSWMELVKTFLNTKSILSH